MAQRGPKVGEWTLPGCQGKQVNLKGIIWWLLQQQYRGRMLTASDLSPVIQFVQDECSGSE